MSIIPAGRLCLSGTLEIWVVTGNSLTVALATNMDPVNKTFIDRQVGYGILCSSPGGHTVARCVRLEGEPLYCSVMFLSCWLEVFSP